MKLCPQCEFLYEDDQIFCDMDGEGLVYDSRAEAFSDAAIVTSASPKQPRPRFMIGAAVSRSPSLGTAYPSPITLQPVQLPLTRSGSLQSEPNLSRQKAARVGR